MKPDLNFRANSARSINVFGTLTDTLVNGVAPEVLRLRSQSNDPITVFINSNGGSTRALEILEGLLRAPNADGKFCRIITVALGNAGSAAATLLASGDYSAAYPSANIHFHGVRLSDAKEVTMERASDLATWLKDTNNSTAIRLAVRFVPRLIFHYSRLKEDFDKISKKTEKQNPSTVECFAIGLQDYLSSVGHNVVKKALGRWRAIEKLSVHVSKRLEGQKLDDGNKFEAAILREIVDYEVEQNTGKDWALNAQGIGQVVEDYSILRDYHAGEHNGFLNPLVETYSPVFMSPSELAAYEKSEGKARDKMKDQLSARIQPFWYFTISLCRYLQEEENPLTNKDAYWLGAVDEVFGSGLPCIREIQETDIDQLKLTENPN